MTRIISRKWTFVALMATILASVAALSPLATGALAQSGASPSAADPDVTIMVDGQPIPGSEIEPGVALPVDLTFTSGDQFIYSTKIVCVPELGPAFPALISGRYKTAVNVHNPNNDPANITKWLTLSPPQGQPPITGSQIQETLGPWYAFDIDCPHMKNDFGLPQGAQTTGGKGFLVVQSDVELDVAAIYTQIVQRPNGVGSSMEVEYIEGRQGFTTHGPDLTVQVTAPALVTGCTTGTGDCNIQVNFAITNLGDVDFSHDFEVKFELTNNAPTTITVPASLGVAAGQTRNLGASFSSINDCFVPNCTTKVTVDPNNLAKELDETNNSDERTDTP